MLWSWRNRPRVDEQPIHVKLSGVLGVFKSYDMHVVGVTHRNRFWRSRQSIIAKLRTGERLSLEREPANKFDPMPSASSVSTGKSVTLKTVTLISSRSKWLRA